MNIRGTRKGNAAKVTQTGDAMRSFKKKTGLKSLLQVVILFCFALYFVIIVLSGAVYHYVHERHIPMLLFSATVFCAIGIVRLRSLPQSREQQGYTGIFSVIVFALALVGMLMMGGQRATFSQFSHTDSLASQSAASYAFTPPPKEKQDGKKPSSDIVMDDTSFAGWLTELYTKPDAWVGKKITARGAVWKDTEFFGKDQFAVARMMMICCAADMQPVGILVKWKGIHALKDGEWVEVTGTLSKQPYKDTFDPLIVAESVKTIAVPQNVYIYP